MTLDDWLKHDWLHSHSTSAQEIRTLLHGAGEDLRNARADGISPGWRLSMAYTAALRCARAALYARGYRPGREREHERTIDSLGLTLPEVTADTIRLLHVIRKRRHTAVYDSVDMISEADAEAAVKTAVRLRTQVADWSRANHPHLLVA